MWQPFDRTHVDGDPARSGERGRTDRVAVGFESVADQHDPASELRRHVGKRAPDPCAHIALVAAHLSGATSHGRGRTRNRLCGRFLSEHDQARNILGSLNPKRCV